MKMFDENFGTIKLCQPIVNHQGHLLVYPVTVLDIRPNILLTLDNEKKSTVTLNFFSLTKCQTKARNVSKKMPVSVTQIA